MAGTESSAAEARQQGIIEMSEAAAEDPSSNINPDIAEEILVEESRKAGAAAFQFNPDASPEDKAAASEAVGILDYLVYIFANLVAKPS
jgi:hypothetical protein